MELRLKKGKGDSTIFRFGLHYHEFQVVEDGAGDSVDWDEVSVSEYGVLLPLDLAPKPGQSKKFALVTSKWRVLDKDRNLARPCDSVLEKEFDSWS